MTGHLLGGAGGVEGVFTVLALHDAFLPATVNLQEPDPTIFPTRAARYRWIMP